jgi:hypothetical protein
MEYEDRNVFYINLEPPEIISSRNPKKVKQVSLSDFDYNLVQERNFAEL